MMNLSEKKKAWEDEIFKTEEEEFDDDWSDEPDYEDEQEYLV